MLEPLVSVCIPVKNGEKSIVRAIDSILVQTYKNLEIVISDNYSSDKTRDILRNLETSDSRVRVFYQEDDIGAFANYDFLRKNARGKYLMLAAHDDTRDKDFIETLVKTMEIDDEIALCMPKTETFLNDKLVWLCCPRSVGTSTFLPLRYFNVVFKFPAVAMYGLFRKGLLDKTRGWNSIHGGDILVIHELSLLGRFAYNESAIFRYHEAPSWKTLEEEKQMILPKVSRASSKRFYFLEILSNQLKGIFQSTLDKPNKALVLPIPLMYLFWNSIVKIALMIIKKSVPVKFKVPISKRFYFKFLHLDSIEITDLKEFGKRNINAVMRFRVYE